LIAASTLSFGMLIARAFWITRRSAGLLFGSEPPAFTAMVMSLPMRANCFAIRFHRANIACLRTSKMRPIAGRMPGCVRRYNVGRCDACCPWRARPSRAPGRPQQIRAMTHRAAPLFARKEQYEASQPFAIGDARAWWIDSAGAPQGGVILYFHGGGFIAECRAVHDPLLAAIGHRRRRARTHDRLPAAPEHPFPAATDDCFAAWNWILSTGLRPRARRVCGRLGGRQPRARHRDARARRGPSAAGCESC
jgi:hypothetical protein